MFAIIFNSKAVLSQWKLRDAAVNFDTYRNLQRHRTVLPAMALLSCLNSLEPGFIPSLHCTQLFSLPLFHLCAFNCNDFDALASILYRRNSSTNICCQTTVAWFRCIIAYVMSGGEFACSAMIIIILSLCGLHKRRLGLWLTVASGIIIYGSAAIVA